MFDCITIKHTYIYTPQYCLYITLNACILFHRLQNSPSEASAPNHGTLGSLISPTISQLSWFAHHWRIRIPQQWQAWTPETSSKASWVHGAERARRVPTIPSSHWGRNNTHWASSALWVAKKVEPFHWWALVDGCPGPQNCKTLAQEPYKFSKVICSSRK